MLQLTSVCIPESICSSSELGSAPGRISIVESAQEDDKQLHELPGSDIVDDTLSRVSVSAALCGTPRIFFSCRVELGFRPVIAGELFVLPILAGFLLRR